MQHKLFLSALIVCGTFYNFGPYAIANPSELEFYLQPKLGSSTKAIPSSFDSTPFISNMKWRSIGPYRGGRSIAVTGSKSRPNEYFFGATGGGVWKTTDGGKKWFPVSDGFFKTASVGAVTVSEVNPDIVLAGTGERDIRGNISHGDGVYLSKDAGKTWTHLGLQETQNISKVIIHPKDPNVLFVAALGPVYGKSSDRGVYKSIDQGKSWKKILSGGANTGTVDLTIDPNNPDVLLAANWEVFRTPYSLSSGGPSCGFFKSTDGGESWSELSRNKGLPQGLLGKIGFTISPVDSNRYWAQIEAEDGGLFMSDDAGQTWQKMNEDRNYRQRAWYYTHVVADPKNKEGVYALNVGFGKSTNAGKSFSSIRVPHGDNHDLWIAPDDPKRMIEANDGGACVSTDGGVTWTELTIPTGQFYHVSTDNSFPYNVLGAQQDNSTVRIPSRTTGNGITKDDWTSTAGGESGYVSAHPTKPHIVFGGNYSGSLEMLNHLTKETRSVDPWPDNPMGHGAIDLDQRFQWTYPILFSHHNPNVMFTCSQFVLRSDNGGKTWKKMSPDLTRNDPSTLQSSGGPITKDNTGVEYYATVFTLAESPKDKNVFWTGSDDGLIHITRDGGKTWTNITPPSMPRNGLASMIEASPFDAGTAYLAVDNHENNDFSPYAYRTTDFGKTWKPINKGISKDTFFRVIREDKEKKGLLYAGTENGVWISFDSGENWSSLSNNLPVTPVHDIAWKDHDLVIATHGRGFYILDDITPLHQLAANMEINRPKLFDPKDPTLAEWGGSLEGEGANPLSGIVYSFYLPETGPVKIEFKDSSGKIVKSISSLNVKKGFNRFSTSLRYPSFKSIPGMILWGAFSSPIEAPPGEYTVTMTAGSVSETQKFRLRKNPSHEATEADLIEKFKFTMEIVAKTNECQNAILGIREVRKSLEENLTKMGTSEPVSQLIANLTIAEEALYQTKMKSGQDPLNYPIRLNNRIAALISTVSGSNFAPTDSSRDVFAKLSTLLKNELTLIQSLYSKDLTEVNKLFVAKGLPTVSTPKQ
jgi:photosystem II stability/assembly factor-like uncharacterized protein